MPKKKTPAKTVADEVRKGVPEDEMVAAPKVQRITREFREMLTRLEQPMVPKEYFSPEHDTRDEGEDAVMVFGAIDVYELCDEIDKAYPLPKATLNIRDHLDAAWMLAEQMNASKAVKKKLKDVIEQVLEDNMR